MNLSSLIKDSVVSPHKTHSRKLTFGSEISDDIEKILNATPAAWKIVYVYVAKWRRKPSVVNDRTISSATPPDPD